MYPKTTADENRYRPTLFMCFKIKNDGDDDVMNIMLLCQWAALYFL